MAETDASLTASRANLRITVEITFTVIGLLIAAIGGWFTIVPVIDKNRKDFLEIQPNIVVGRSYTISGGAQYTVVVKLHNLGKTSAYNVKVLMDGHLGENNITVIHPLHPGHNEYEISLEFDQTSPLRKATIDKAYLRISYDDMWSYRYELTYPVVQTPRNNGLFELQIQLERPKIKRPKVSFFNMRKHLAEVPTGL